MEVLIVVACSIHSSMSCSNKMLNFQQALHLNDSRNPSSNRM